MFLSQFPITLVTTSINPIHFSISISQILKVFSVEAVAAFPIKLAFSMFSILVVFSGILITFWICAIFHPLSFAMFLSLQELSDVESSLSPLILSISVWFAILIES